MKVIKLIQTSRHYYKGTAKECVALASRQKIEQNRDSKIDEKTSHEDQSPDYFG